MSKLAPAPLSTSLEQIAFPSSVHFPFFSLGFLALREIYFILSQPFEDKHGKKVLSSESTGRECKEMERSFQEYQMVLCGCKFRAGTGSGGRRKSDGGRH